jgi:hypothetical protein
MASPSQCGSMAPALHMVGAQIPDMSPNLFGGRMSASPADYRGVRSHEATIVPRGLGGKEEWGC